jgi:hypothetical protein
MNHNFENFNFGFRKVLLLSLFIFFANINAALAHESMPTILSMVLKATGEVNITVEVSQGALDNFSKETNAHILLANQLPQLIKLKTEAGDLLELNLKEGTAPEAVSEVKPQLADFKFVYAVMPQEPLSTMTIIWPKVLGNAILKLNEHSAQTTTLWIKGDVESENFSLLAKTEQSFFDFVSIGFQHILPEGLDHILFILGLYFFSTQLKPLLLQISAFTLAHTVTLFMATLGILSIDEAIVEPIIALSIVYIAVDNLRKARLTHMRIALVFGCGLLHGLGFAGALSEIGLEAQTYFRDLIAFNIGLELGQLFVVFVMHIALGFWFAKQPYWNSKIKKPLSICIATIGFIWFIQRI